jgi:Predicted GTPase
MLQTAANILSDNLQQVAGRWPDFDREVEPFYLELSDAIVDVGALRGSLGNVSWAARTIEGIRDETRSKMRTCEVDGARKHRKQAFARMADVMDEIQTDLRSVGDARDDLRDLPDINPDEPAIVAAGYPNVGKSSFVNTVTRASNEIAEYPFTTRGIQIGHLTRDRIRYQLIDTPGLLDRPEPNGTISSGRQPRHLSIWPTVCCFSSMHPGIVGILFLSSCNSVINSRTDSPGKTPH